MERTLSAVAMLALLVLAAIGVFIWYASRSSAARADRATGPGRAGLTPRSVDPLDDQLRRWVAAGLIEPAQAGAIAESERSREAAGEARGGRPSWRGEGVQRSSLVAEAVGYLGGALLLGGLVAALARNWSDLGTAGRVAVAGAGVVAFWVGGVLLRHRTDPPARRLLGVLWFLSVGTMALFAGILAADAGDVGAPGTVLGVGLAAAAYGAVLWGLRPDVLQQVALYGGVVAATMGVLAVAGVDDAAAYGVLLWLLGIGWLLSGRRGWLPPAAVADALAVVTLVVAGYVVAGEHRAWGLLLALATACGLVGASVPARNPVWLAAGVVGLFVVTPQLVIYFFGDQLGVPLTLFLSGAALLALAASLPQLTRRVRLHGRPPTAPVA